MITIDNVAPVVTAAASDTDINEGDTFDLDTTTFVDPGSLDTHTATIDWGDGSPTEPGTVGAGTVTGSHQYANNGVYIVTVTVDDDDGGAGMDTVAVTVQNGDLTVNVTGDTTGDEGTDTISVTAAYVDSGTPATHTATIDWGDGDVDNCATPACSIVQNGDGSGTVTGNHIVADDGNYSVVVIVTDDSADQGSGGLVVTIANVAPTASIAGLPGSKKEGKKVTVSGVVSDPGTENFSYSWEVKKNGATFKTGSGLSCNFRPDDNGTYDVTFTADDGDGGVTMDAGSVTVNNVDPVATILHEGVPLGDFAILGNEGDEVTLMAGVVDSGSADTFTYSWQLLLLGVPIATGEGSKFTFTPPASGLFFVSLDVDNDNNPGDTDTGTDSVLTQFNNLPPTIDSLAGDGTPSADINTNLQVNFSDPGTADDLTLTVDWCDGTTDVFNLTASPVLARHTFGSSAVRTVEV